MNDLYRRALDELKSLEYQWANAPDDFQYKFSSGYYCPRCGVAENRKHTSQCSLGNIIKDLENIYLEDSVWKS